MPEQKPVTPAGPVARPAPDAGHVPMSEEFDKAKWTLPPPKIVGVALLIVAVLLAVVVVSQRPQPTSTGTVDEVVAAEQPDKASVLVAVNLTIHNLGPKPFWVHAIRATVKTDQGEFSDEAANAVDFERYFQAFPTLKQHAGQPIKEEDKIPVGGRQQGTIIVGFPVNQDAFEHRKSFTVTVDAYDQRPLVITK